MSGYRNILVGVDLSGVERRQTPPIDPAAESAIAGSLSVARGCRAP